MPVIIPLHLGVTDAATKAEQLRITSQQDPAAVQHAADLIQKLTAVAPEPTIVSRLEGLSTPAKAALGAGVALLAYFGLKGKR